MKPPPWFAPLIPAPAPIKRRPAKSPHTVRMEALRKAGFIKNRATP